MQSNNKLTTEYNVTFKVDEPDVDFYVEFTCCEPTHVIDIIASLACYWSGDNCVCHINGEEALLDECWGLAEPKQEAKDD